MSLIKKNIKETESSGIFEIDGWSDESQNVNTAQNLVTEDEKKAIGFKLTFSAPAI